MYPPLTTVRAKMDATGIGYAGIEGVWWLPACQPFVWPQPLQLHLQWLLLHLHLIMNHHFWKSTANRFTHHLSS